QPQLTLWVWGLVGHRLSHLDKTEWDNDKRQASDCYSGKLSAAAGNARKAFCPPQEPSFSSSSRLERNVVQIAGRRGIAVFSIVAALLTVSASTDKAHFTGCDFQ